MGNHFSLCNPLQIVERKSPQLDAWQERVAAAQGEELCRQRRHLVTEHANKQPEKISARDVQVRNNKLILTSNCMPRIKQR